MNTTMTKRQAQAHRNFQLDIWEWSNHFGEGIPVSFEDWANYVYGKGVTTYREGYGLSDSGAGKTWHRFQRRVRGSQYPVEFLKIEGNRFVRFPPGTSREMAKILDGYNRARDIEEFYKVVRSDAERYDAGLAAYMDDQARLALPPEDRPLRDSYHVPRFPHPRIPSWVFAAVIDLGIHLEVACPNCGESEGLTCLDKENKPKFHLERVYAAMAARDQINDEEDA